MVKAFKLMVIRWAERVVSHTLEDLVRSSCTTNRACEPDVAIPFPHAEKVYLNKHSYAFQ